MRASLAVAAGLVLLVGLAATASARVIDGADRADVLRGTSRADVIRGHGGADRILGRGGADLLHGGAGRDSVLGGAGGDRISVEHDGASDRVGCGPGRDIVTADRLDGVARDCEVVARAVSRDPYRNAEAQHGTQVEPDSFAWGATIVSTFQSGRYTTGGASNIGWATSRDGGRSWRHGFLPRLTRYSQPAGTGERASDPVVAYDAAHRVWLITSLVIGPRTQLTISRSTDGRRWGAPLVAASAGAAGGLVAYDKQWLACDNGPSSPYRGRCYLSYTDMRAGRSISTQTSTDGGRTWSAPVFTAPGEAVGAFPVIRPSGELVVVLSDWASVFAARSTDGGASFVAPVRISGARGPNLGNYRAFPSLPSADVDRDGRLYVTWFDCRFRADCSAADVVLATSRDGGLTWDDPVRVPTGAGPSRVPVTPAVAVDPSTTGTRARLAIVYYTLSRVPCGSCTIDAWLVRSSNGGASWGRPQRLTAMSMRSAWLPQTTLGRMLADYVSVTWTRGRPVAVFALASEPVGGAFRQAIFATTRLP